MPDLLTHVLVGYILGTLLTTWFDWQLPFTTVVMLGAILPDLTKIQLVVSDVQIELFIGIPFSWQALHTFGGVTVMAGFGGLFTPRRYRRRVLLLLLVGSVSHLCLDSLLIKPSGYASAVWWPITATRLPTPGLYLSYDRWPAVLAAFLALITRYWSMHRHS
ncbi:metal-dependent hydrolase [Halopenitus persicus]|uniref:LexA-binding, inner membrane-associated putative hydrolase n=1 Tax=Halopenitus persicus TaxID=1048396 RepID=A0A1H3MD59_9EURY|nr:metal-dependent hydrolase [Halopenitus persicus]SDY74641.1 LexA-binding, inner membrane-associated putative hydrolase [Halopenitus persicus]